MNFQFFKPTRRLDRLSYFSRPLTVLERRIAVAWFNRCGFGGLVKRRIALGGDFYVVRNNVVPMRPRHRNPLGLPPTPGGGGLAA